MNIYKRIHPLEFHRKFLESKCRADNRALSEVRQVGIDCDVIGSADGSSTIRLGGTVACCGVRAECGVTPANRHDCVSVHVHTLPVCNPKFYDRTERSNTSDTISQWLTSLLEANRANVALIDSESLNVDYVHEGAAAATKDDDGSDSMLVDDETLKLSRTSYTWVLSIDVYFLSYDGNAFDVALLAMISALRDVRLPRLKMDGVSQRLVVDESGLAADYDGRVVLRRKLSALSFALIDEYMIADPCEDEEALSSSAFTIVFDDSGRLCGVLKAGGASISDQNLQGAMALAKKHSQWVFDTFFKN